MITKYIMTCLFASFVGIVSAQYQNYELKAPESSSNTYVGRDYVRLLPGYSFSAVTSGKTMNAKVSSALTPAEANTIITQVVPNTTYDNITTINKNLAVGEIPISSTVSPSGAKCYNVPIEIVPGRMGFQPNISLSYNSQAGNGIMGMGWNISGLSSIERVNKNYYYDGKNDIPSLSADDAFTLDGVRLIETSRSTSQIVYETSQGNIKVEAIMNYNTSGSHTNPVYTYYIDYFKVFYPNGTIGIFGSETRDQVSLSAPLTKLIDMNGSTITFLYDTTDNVDLNSGTKNEVYYIKEINYGQCADKLDFGKIIFSYESRPDQIFSLHSNISSVYRNRLSKIESFVNTNLVRSYQLAYSNVDPRVPSNQNDVSRLTQIGSFVNAGSLTGENLNPLKFYYGKTGALTTNVQSTSLASSNFDLTKIDIVRGKFDLNSQNDAIMVYLKADIYRNVDHNVSFPNYPADSDIKIYQNLNSPTSKFNSIKAESGFLGLMSANIDGVSNDEVIKINTNGDITNEEIKFQIYKPNESLGLVLDREEIRSFDTYVSDTYWDNGGTYDYIDVYSIAPKKFYAGNFTGKGISEVLVIPSTSNKIHLIDLTLNALGFSQNNFFSLTTGNIYPMDVDGDGQTEIVYVTPANTKVYKYKSVSGFVEVGTWTLTISDFDNRQILFSDLNGDGKTDIIIPPKVPTVWSHNYPVNSFNVGTTVRCPNCGQLRDALDPNTIGPSYTVTCTNTQCKHQFNGYPFFGEYDTFLHKRILVSSCVICKNTTHVESGCPTHGILNNINYNYNHTQQDTYDKKWRYLYSNGLSTPLVIEKDFVNREYNQQYSIQDIDGDNTPELIGNLNGGVKVYPYRDNDHAFDIVPICTFNISNTSEILSFDIVSQTINYDVNSDKKFSQLITLSKSSIDKYIFSQNRAKNNQISLMINSLGVADKTNYDQLYQGANYTPGTAAIFPNTDFQGPMWVATQNSVMYNKQLISNTTYNYTGAIWHKQGLGLRGFTIMKSTDLMTNKVATTEFEPYKMGAIKKITTDTEESIFDYTFTDYSNAIDGNKKMKLLINNKTVTDKLKGNSVIVTYSGYDDYGNVGYEITNFSGDKLNKTTIENTWDNKVNGNIYMLGMLTNRKTTTERGSKTFVQNEGYEYYDVTKKCRLQFARKSIYKNAQTKMPVADTEYKYNDNYGTLSEEIVHNKITNMSTDDLTTSYTYWDDDKCSLKTKTDPMGLATNYSYNFSTRLLNDVTDYLGNKVTYSYDKWRRKNSEVSNVGTDEITSTFDLKWNTEAEPKRLFQLTSTTTGQPTVTTFADVYGRETRKAIAGFTEGTNVFADKEYDNFGHLKISSAPYNSTESPLWTSYNYDQYDRPIKVLQPNGSTTTYAYTNNTISENKDGVSTSKTTDATGRTTSTTDAGGKVSYIYRADGQPESVNAAGVVTSFEYDDYGRQTKLIDPSAGTVETIYDDANHKATQKWNSGKEITIISNKFGQTTSKTTPDFTTTYSYDPTYKRPTGSTTTNGTSKGVEYDTYGRLWKSTETVSGKTYQEVYGYDNGRIGNINYNTGTESLLTNLTSVVYKYNSNGYLYRLEDEAGNRLREVNSVNELGQEKSVLLGNGLTTTKNYTPEGLWTNVTTTNNIQNMSFNFNRINGMLNSRTDVTKDLTESFAYDGLYRLISFGSKTMDYNPNGNINTKSDVGAESIYKYNDETNAKPYTLFKIYNATTVDLANQLDIDYTVMSRPTSIRNTTTGLSVSFTYNDGYDRATMQVKQGSTETMNKYYFCGGKYEIETVGGIEKQRLYVDGSPYTASVLLEKTGAAVIQTYYLHRDYLGSITQISNNSGTLAAEYSYDAWGRMRNPLNWTLYPQGSQPTMSYGMRGYTGHEHLNQFGIINMNARLYDPILARFLAPDPYVGSGLTNDFNRYIYCRNNPMMYTDPSGKFIQWIIAGIILAAKSYNDGYKANHNEANPLNWDWKNATYSLGVGGTPSNGISSFSVNAGIGWNTGTTPVIGFSKSGFGFGYQSFGGNFFVGYPGYNYDKAAENGYAAIAATDWGQDHLQRQRDFMRSGTLNCVYPEFDILMLGRYSSTRAMISGVESVSTSSIAEYWPKDRGALNGWEYEISQKGQLFDRYGLNSGTYVSPLGTPIEMRGLSPNANLSSYIRMEVLEPFPMKTSTIAPAFNSFGFGIQHEFPASIYDMERWGFIKLY